MSTSAFALTVPHFTRSLNKLLGQMDKAEAWATERKFNVDVLAMSRLAPDMHPFTFQVQSATDRAKFAVARLAGQAAPSWPDDETTFEALRGRVNNALAYVATFSEADLEGGLERQLTLPSRAGDKVMSGSDYLFNSAFPNFYFHLTTAYNILRHNGVLVGKSDFVG